MRTHLKDAFQVKCPTSHRWMCSIHLDLNPYLFRPVLSAIMAVANDLCKQAFLRPWSRLPNFYRLGSGPLIGRLNTKIHHYRLDAINRCNWSEDFCFGKDNICEYVNNWKAQYIYLALISAKWSTTSPQWCKVPSVGKVSFDKERQIGVD